MLNESDLPRAIIISGETGGAEGAPASTFFFQGGPNLRDFFLK